MLDFYVSDPRTNDWFLIGSPMPGLTILAAYLYFITTWGPRYMKHRKPYELKNTLIIYNFIQVLVSIYLVYEVSIRKRLIGELWQKMNIKSLKLKHDLYRPKFGKRKYLNYFVRIFFKAF